MMKLDPDCIRDILLTVEKSDLGHRTTLSELSESLPNYSPEDLIYTCLKLDEGGLLSIAAGHYVGSEYPTVHWIKEITYSGHEFLENIRSPKTWTAVKKGCEGVGNFALKTISAIATGVATAAINNYLSGN